MAPVGSSSLGDTRLVEPIGSSQGLRKRTPFLTGKWLHLLMAQWCVPRAVLLPLVPHGVELDVWNEEPYVSLVAFRFLDTRLLGLPIPFHRDFTEVNLRFYVIRRAPEGIRRGVVFIREYVPRFWIAYTAKLLYNEPYQSVQVNHTRQRRGDSELVSFRWRVGKAEHGVDSETSGDPTPMVPGSPEAMIAEHYWGYTAQRNGTTVEYQVAHPSWRVWRSPRVSLSWNPGACYGAPWGELLRSEPEFSFMAEGSPISVSWGSPISLDR